MTIFKKKESITQNITYMAIMAAINVVFVLMAYFVPPLLFLLVFFLPLTSTMVTLLCKKRYLPIYIIATIGLCLLTTMKDFSDTLFYVIPSIFSGLIFGICIEKKVPSSFSIFLSILITIGFTYAFVPLINFLYKCNIIEVFAGIFGLKDYKFLNYVVPVFIFLISLIQTLITFMVVKMELPKMGFETNDEIAIIPLSIAELICVIFVLIFAFVYPELSLVFSCGIFYFFCYLLVDIISERKIKEIIASGIALIVTIVIYITTYNLVPQPLAILLINIFPICTSLSIFLFNIFKRDNKVIKN